MEIYSTTPPIYMSKRQFLLLTILFPFLSGISRDGIRTFSLLLTLLTVNIKQNHTIFRTTAT